MNFSDSLKDIKLIKVFFSYFIVNSIVFSLVSTISSVLAYYLHKKIHTNSLSFSFLFFTFCGLFFIYLFLYTLCFFLLPEHGYKYLIGDFDY